MLKLCRVAKVKVFFLLLVYVFNFDLFEFSARHFGEGSIRGICFLFYKHRSKQSDRYFPVLLKFGANSVKLVVIKKNEWFSGSVWNWKFLNTMLGFFEVKSS